MTLGKGPAAPPIPQRSTTADIDSSGNPHRHPDGADSSNGARPKNSGLARREYDLLAQAEPVGNPISAGTQLSRGSHEATMGTDDQDQQATETGDGIGQCALLARGMSEDKNKERRPPKWKRVLNACGHHGGGGGGPLTR